MEDEYYLTLPSNSSMKYFPDNTLTLFTTKLPTRMQLDESWVCALAEISYPRTWATVLPKGGKLRIKRHPPVTVNFPPMTMFKRDEITVRFLEEFFPHYIDQQTKSKAVKITFSTEHNKFMILLRPDTMVRISEAMALALGFDGDKEEEFHELTVAPSEPVLTAEGSWWMVIHENYPLALDFEAELDLGYYDNPEKLADSLNSVIIKKEVDVTFAFNPLSKGVKVSIPKDTTVELSEGLGILLGFGGKTKIDKSTTSPYPVDLESGFYNIYIYCDIVEPSVVGDSLAPLLRSLQVSGKGGDFITKTFDRPYYRKLLKHQFETISIYLEMMLGILFHLDRGA